MNIMMVTTPIRPVPTSFPPMGSLSIVKYLRTQGLDVEFYNIDANRPTYEDAVQHIIDANPDVLGISSVVSTAYSYTKQLSLDVKAALPNTLIVVGGNLAASAEIILQRTGTDICVIGEGEKAFFDICKRAETTSVVADFADIHGATLLDEHGHMVEAGFAQSLPKSEVYNYDYADLEETSDMSVFFMDAFDENGVFPWFEKDTRAFEKHRKDKKVTIIPGSKGCVARCTFCHRWDKGIRYIPVDQVIERIKEVMEKYNVGFLGFGDENFGTDSRWLKEFCEKVKELDVLWHVGGMRVNCITPDEITMMKDAGCCSINYGMETGSPDILQVMEKKTKIEDNRNAMRWTVGAKIQTVVQLVLGMPGESTRTAVESAEFCKYALTLDKSQNPNDLSINYAQALPGTPLYEYARHLGLIGDDLDSEEEYLELISDKNASDATHNFTDAPRLVCFLWRPRIRLEVLGAYVKKFGLAHYHKVLAHDGNFFKQSRPISGYYNEPKLSMERGAENQEVKDDRLPGERTLVSDSIHSRRERLEADGDVIPSLWKLLKGRKFNMILICHPHLVYPFRNVMLPLYLLLSLTRGRFRDVGDVLKWAVLPRKKVTFQSLRRTVEKDMGGYVGTTDAMNPLRKGR
ncbi:MAG: radical SAM protein [Rhodospirillaceae bacterium]|nr:MAG: radical SAM protein [Rhodospirillaceae bacterium]